MPQEIVFEWVDALKLAMALVVGGAIGAEREMRDKAAGFRTNIMICLGATIFTIMSLRLASGQDDATRIASNIVTGIGFLGAGVIIRDRGKVIGLTTASTIWVVAALGMAIGASHYALAALAAGFVIVVLWFLPEVEVFLGKSRERRMYRVTTRPGEEHAARLDEYFSGSGLNVQKHRRMKRADSMLYEWDAIGPAAAHEGLSRQLIDDDAVIEFEV